MIKRLFQAVFLSALFLNCCLPLKAQTKSSSGGILAATPPMGWMSWNYFGEHINEKELRGMADALVSSGMAKAGYKYLFIDDGWQGGRDNRNNMIADPEKFPSGIKALADYVHSKGLKLGIYSDAAQLTCAGYTASLNFEDQDAKTFALWGVDYLKYDYCGAPADSATAVLRYKKMSDALRRTGREITFGICEWGDRKPWHWAANAGGQLWRTTADVRDKWKSTVSVNKAVELHGLGAGILDIVDINGGLSDYAKPGAWNDMDMLVIGLYGKKGPSGDLGGIGCSDIEYQSQMSLWSIMASPLAVTADIRNMNATTKRILLNEEIIAINQDALGKQAQRKINDRNWSVFIKPLINGDYAIAILNRSADSKNYTIRWPTLGLNGGFVIRDVWQHKIVGKGRWKGRLAGHETRVFRITKRD